MLRTARLLWLFIRLGAQHELAYLGNLAAQALLSGTNLAASLAFLALVYGRTDSLAGWRPPELLALWGVFHVLMGLLGAVVQPSLQRLIEDVHRGAFDHTLAKPVDAQLLASVQQVQVWRLLDTGLGVALLAVAVVRLPAGVGMEQALSFVVALALGGAMVYGCCLTVATLVFWLGQIENVLLAFLTLWEAGRWPVSLYPEWLRFGLTVLVPVAFATTVPAEALSGRLEPLTLASAAGLAACLLLASRWAWRRGLRRYSGGVCVAPILQATWRDDALGQPHAQGFFPDDTSAGDCNVGIGFSNGEWGNEWAVVQRHRNIAPGDPRQGVARYLGETSGQVRDG